MKNMILAGAMAAIGLASPAFAWGDMGHMTVAAVAWENLDPKSREYVTQLLKLNPQYPDWVKNVKPADRAKIAFMRAATWPDVYVRGAKDDDEKDAVDKPYADENVGYSDPWVRGYWHYTNISYATGGAPDIAEKKPNAVTRIKDFSSALNNKNLSAGIRSYDLSWLIHLVGDIHQPLHAVARVTPENREGDHGGNTVRVCKQVCNPVFKENQSLHSFWDSAIGTSRNPVKAIVYADGLIAANPGYKSDSDNPDEWAAESYELSKIYVYVHPIGPKDYKAYVMNDTYRAKAGLEANKRIMAAGIRLADLIETNTPD